MYFNLLKINYNLIIKIDIEKLKYYKFIRNIIVTILLVDRKTYANGKSNHFSRKAVWTVHRCPDFPAQSLRSSQEKCYPNMFSIYVALHVKLRYMILSFIATIDPLITLFIFKNFFFFNKS